MSNKGNKPELTNIEATSTVATTQPNIPVAEGVSNLLAFRVQANVNLYPVADFVVPAANKEEAESRAENILRTAQFRITADTQAEDFCVGVYPECVESEILEVRAPDPTALSAASSVHGSAEPEALATELMKVARATRAIDKCRAEEISQRDPVSILEALVGLSFRVRNKTLKAVVSSHEREIVDILCRNKRVAHSATGILFDLEDLIERNNEDLQRAAALRDSIEAERLEPVIDSYSREALRRSGIRRGLVIMVASQIFTRFAQRVLEFTPNLAPESDPRTGLKLWMFFDFGRGCFGLPVNYQWPEAAHLVIKAQDFNCQEETFRAALMCLQSTFTSKYRHPSLLAKCAGLEPGSWPVWPPEQGPYTLRPPSCIDDFLSAVLVGAASIDSESAEPPIGRPPHEPPAV